MKKYLSIFFIVILTFLCCFQFAFGQATQKSTFSTNESNQNQLYWIKSPSGDFLYESGDITRPNPKCKVQYGKKYTSSFLKSHPIVAYPKDDWYLSAFYNQNGQKLSPKTVNYSLLKISYHGEIYYDYFRSKNNPIYKLLPPFAYNEIVKTYVKAVYGTTSYKVVGKFKGYNLGKKNTSIRALFKEKTTPKLNLPHTKAFQYGSITSFYLLENLPKGKVEFKSSNPKVAKIDKSIGKVDVFGEGLSTLTTTLSPTATVKGKVFQTTLKVVPPKPNICEISKQGSSKVKVTWAKDLHSSGYILRISQSKSFASSKKVTILSPKTGSYTFKDLNNGSTYYIKMRTYKKSCNQTIKSHWSEVKKVVI